jgi:uncharacterized membrane protein
MRELLALATEYSVLVINAIALFVILAGTLEAFVRGVAMALSPVRGHPDRDVWLRYARWLVAGLTFQLAADIIETSVAPNWDQIGRIAAIAVIRTFLNYFLERDIREIGERRPEPAPA